MSRDLDENLESIGDFSKSEDKREFLNLVGRNFRETSVYLKGLEREIVYAKLRDI